jgi:hypothetical protein
MTKKEKQEKRENETKEYAKKLLESMRGAYIIGQALYVAIKEMSKVPEPYTEHSNITDMRLLMNAFFPIYAMTQEIQDLMNKVEEKENNK